MGHREQESKIYWMSWFMMDGFLIKALGKFGLYVGIKFTNQYPKYTATHNELERTKVERTKDKMNIKDFNILTRKYQASTWFLLSNILRTCISLNKDFFNVNTNIQKSRKHN